MTRTLTFPSTALRTALSTGLAVGLAAVLSACGGAQEQTITERNTRVLSDAEVADAADATYLNPARDPEGDQLLGEPEGEPGEAVDYESVNENTDGNDPIETADRDADPSD